MFDLTFEMIRFSESENRKNNRKTFEGASVKQKKGVNGLTIMERFLLQNLFSDNNPEVNLIFSSRKYY